ncbi:hypothetical protein IW262DRAFT_1459126 [Armillaria fumosa]|nr:hypothetical protein IW262DRAFT_1459126 [Armillaria fumosa]
MKLRLATSRRYRCVNENDLCPPSVSAIYINPTTDDPDLLLDFPRTRPTSCVLVVRPCQNLRRMYSLPPPNRTVLDCADLAIIGLSKASTEVGRTELTAQVCEAINKQGFFYVVNHRYTPEQTARIFSIANMAFDNVDGKEKVLYAGKSPDIYSGYKPK